MNTPVFGELCPVNVLCDAVTDHVLINPPRGMILNTWTWTGHRQEAPITKLGTCLPGSRIWGARRMELRSKESGREKIGSDELE